MGSFLLRGVRHCLSEWEGEPHLFTTTHEEMEAGGRYVEMGDMGMK
jgi:hypothetical protein